MMIVRKITGKITKKFISIFMSGLILFGSLSFLSLSATSFASYEPNAHDDQFAQMFSYKVEGIITDRGEVSRILIVESLREFAKRFSVQDPRFAYIVRAVSDIVENTEANYIINILGSGTNLKAKNDINEANSVLWITDVSQYQEEENNNLSVALTIVHNPDKTSYANQIPSTDNGTIDAQIHCNIYADSPFPGSSTSPGVIGPRGRAYGMTYSHVALDISESIKFSEEILGSFELPELPNNIYTLMCSVVIVDTNTENQDDSVAYRSAYYYFDVEVE